MPDRSPFSAQLVVPEAPPVVRWAAARAFTERCRAYALAEIARRNAAERDSGDWNVYLRFCEHTLRELDDGTLDGWFDPEIPQPPTPG